MAPIVVAKSGMVVTLEIRLVMREAEADAAEGDGDGQAHGEHRAERDDEDDDGEREADDLGLRGLEPGERLAADLDLRGRARRPRSRSARSCRSSPSVAGLGERELVADLDPGERDLAGEVALGAPPGPAADPRAVRADDRDAVGWRRRSRTARSIAAWTVGVVDALVGLEDDGAAAGRSPKPSKLSSRTSKPVRLSDSGASGSPPKSEPTMLTSVDTAMIATTQAAATIRRCRKHHCPTFMYTPRAS